MGSRFGRMKQGREVAFLDFIPQRRCRNRIADRFCPVTSVFMPLSERSPERRVGCSSSVLPTIRSEVQAAQSKGSSYVTCFRLFLAFFSPRLGNLWVSSGLRIAARANHTGHDRPKGEGVRRLFRSELRVGRAPAVPSPKNLLVRDSRNSVAQTGVPAYERTALNTNPLACILLQRNAVHVLTRIWRFERKNWRPKSCLFERVKCEGLERVRGP